MTKGETTAASSRMPSAWLQLLAVLTFGGLSFLSLNFAGEIEHHVSPVWPASGLAMAIVFFGGRKFWLAIFLGSLASNGITTWMQFPDLPVGRVLLPSFGIAVGAALEALAAAWFLRNRAGGRGFCMSAAHASAFVVQVALISASISALIGPAFLMFSGLIPLERWGMVVLTWFVGDATGILVFGSVLVFPWRSVDYESLRGRWLEIIFLFLTLALVGGTMTGIYEKPGLQEWPLAYMILPVILWAVFHFNHLGTLASLVFVTLLSVGGSALGREVFPSSQAGYALFFLQMFLLIVSAAAWAVCGRVNELQIITNRLEALAASQVVAQREKLRRREERLAVVAHDLQVPLIGIRNLVELLLNPRRVGDDPEKSRRLLTQVGEASEQACALAGRLLDEQEIEQVQSLPETINWVDLVSGVARRASMLEASKKLRFVTQSEQTHIEGSVDRMVVMQVLENLCHNAAKVSPRGGSITLGVREEGKIVVLTIADEGPGFRQEEIPALFTHLAFRNRIRTLPESTGLGLFIVGKAVRELGGTITCESPQGKGAVFTIRLPRKAG
jgi:signal transduction histidine kinase